MKTYILGISAYYHDSSAALLCNGEIIAAAQEERFSRKKADPRFPKSSIEYCLAEARIGIEDIDHVVFYENSLRKFERLCESYFAFVPRGFDFFKHSFRTWSSSKLQTKNNILKELGGKFCGEFHFTEHHASHAASAFFPSPYDEAAILTIDAVGEWSTSSLAYGNDHNIKMLKEMRFPHSLGMLYSAFTYYTGFKVNSGEYKLMGLAPYGRPLYADLIKKNLIEIYPDGSLWMDMSYFNYCYGSTMTSPKFHQLFGGSPRAPETDIQQKDMDIAASIQAVTEEIIIKMAQYAQKETGSKNLVLAGGVALNCVANGKLLREGPFENIWVQPAAGDAGGSLGAALLFWHQKLSNTRIPQKTDSQKGTILGPTFSNSDIKSILDSRTLHYEYFADESKLLEAVTEALTEEKIIGWFQGRMEYGPRSLGCRSIIGDARSQKMQQIMNLKIKFRESFRPFAPSVLKEFAHEIFEVTPEVDDPYMLFVAPIKENCKRQLTAEEKTKMQDPDLRIRVTVPRSKYPAITHVDYSARIQTVDEKRHGRYYRLIKKFHEKTGSPLIVNTSFNIRGEPIVCDPEDAILCFLATDMDCLVMENFIIKKEEQDKNLLAYANLSRERHKKMYALD
ncbi:MAG: carbamoyltransferase [Patescibacteria group bacterium]